MTRIALATVLFLLFPKAPIIPTGDDNTPLTLRILPAHQFAPGTVSYRIHIQPHRDNIWFCMGWSSTTATIVNRTSCQQLNGIYSPRVIYQNYRDVGPGVYDGFVDVYHAPNYRAHTATQTFIVLAQN